MLILAVTSPGMIHFLSNSNKIVYKMVFIIDLGYIFMVQFNLHDLFAYKYIIHVIYFFSQIIVSCMPHRQTIVQVVCFVVCVQYSKHTQTSAV